MSAASLQSHEPTTTTPPRVSDLYVVRRGDLQADAEDILRLWQYLPGDAPPQQEKLDWFYRNNPAGPGVVYFLDFKPEGRPVGVVCLGPRAVRVGNETVSGAVFGDFAVEPAHRSLGPALMFQKAFLKLAQEEFSMVFGFPNDLSGKVRSFGGYKIDFPLGIFVLPLDFRPYLGKRLPGLLAAIGGGVLNVASWLYYAARVRALAGGHRRAAVDDAFLDGLWERVSSGPVSAGVRDARFLNWRLKQVPNREYHFVGVTDRDGLPAAYLAWTRRHDGALNCIDCMAVSDVALSAVFRSVAAEHIGRARALAVTLARDHARSAAALKACHFRERDQFDCFVSRSADVPQDAAAESLFLSFADNDV